MIKYGKKIAAIFLVAVFGLLLQQALAVDEHYISGAAALLKRCCRVSHCWRADGGFAELCGHLSRCDLAFRFRREQSAL